MEDKREYNDIEKLLKRSEKPIRVIRKKKSHKNYYKYFARLKLWIEYEIALNEDYADQHSNYENGYKFALENVLYQMNTLSGGFNGNNKS